MGTLNTIEGIPATLNLNLYRDRSFTKTILFKDKYTGKPLDFTNWTGRAQIKKEKISVETLAEFVVDLFGANGIVIISLTAEQTNNMSLTSDQKAYWDLLMIDGEGNYFPYLEGQITLNETVTR